MTFGFGWVAGSRDDEQKATGAKESGNVFDRPRAQVGRQNLERVGLKDKIESATPSRGRIEQIGGEVFHFRSRKSFVGSANRSLGDIERGGMETPSGELFGIVAQAAADRQRGFSHG